MDSAVAAAVAEAHRADWGFVLAATYRITRDLDAAEDCVQDAYSQALTAWPAQRHPGQARSLADPGRAPTRDGPDPRQRPAAPPRACCVSFAAFSLIAVSIAAQSAVNAPAPWRGC
jgi:hypothetical protein